MNAVDGVVQCIVILDLLIDDRLQCCHVIVEGGCHGYGILRPCRGTVGNLVDHACDIPRGTPHILCQSVKVAAIPPQLVTCSLEARKVRLRLLAILDHLVTHPLEHVAGAKRQRVKIFVFDQLIDFLVATTVPFIQQSPLPNSSYRTPLILHYRIFVGRRKVLSYFSLSVIAKEIKHLMFDSMHTAAALSSRAG